MDLSIIPVHFPVVGELPAQADHSIYALQC